MSSRKKVVYLKDYQEPHYQIESADLHFDLEPTQTIVKSKLRISLKDDKYQGSPLVLDGEDLKLLTIKLNEKTLDAAEYAVDATSLTINHVPDEFDLEIEVEINPKENTDLSGLYMSGTKFCTQCEPHGFRHITYFIDRPDNLSLFRTTIVADKNRYPHLLSNGNLIAQDNLDNGKHSVTWEDPFPKPSYLFALVAAHLDLLEDTFTTMSGREIELKLYVDRGHLDKATHAMDSLKKAMLWDEQQYGREYDLNTFMIVAVRDFNMGAMENKGLNIFNSKYILANPQTATDTDYENILMVVGHEYFHNWSGNRVTCRDWFQLSLKEGFTVLRDQTFTADHTSEAIKRIDDINILRTHQFAEDAGPTAHAVQPDSYMEINNFYTQTIYNKGAEVIRMMRTLLGEDNYRKGTDLYFERHDGQAVTIEEFVKAMEDASGLDLEQFRRWYVQAGTPKLVVSDNYDAQNKSYSLTFKQETPPTPQQDNKQPLHIPIALGLLNEQGEEILATTVLDFNAAQQTFTFSDIASKPIPSLLRQFSAPVYLDYDYSDKSLGILLAHDTDTFARYEAGQIYAIRVIKELYSQYMQKQELIVPASYLEVIGDIIKGDFEDKAMQTLLLTLPAENYLLGLIDEVDPVALHHVRKFLRQQIATHYAQELRKLYDDNQSDAEYQNTAAENARRRIKNCALSYLNLLDDGELALEQYANANNMTDTLAAMTAIANSNHRKAPRAIHKFYVVWRHDMNVLDKWFAVHAMADRPNQIEKVKQLQTCFAYEPQNPNNLRALIGSFCNNIANFHAIDGSGYELLADEIIKTDKFNRQIAAGLVKPFLRWRQFDKERQALIKAQLERIMAEKDLSKNTHEVVEKALNH